MPGALSIHICILYCIVYTIPSIQVYDSSMRVNNNDTLSLSCVKCLACVTSNEPATVGISF